MKQKLKILHLVSWFPHEKEPYLGNFIAQHIRCLNSATDSYILHAIPAQENQAEFTEHLGTPLLRMHFVKKARLVSLSQALERGIRTLADEKGFIPDLIHLHVSYPAGVALLRSKTPVVITEHFSGYLPSRSHRFKLWEKLIIKRILRKAQVVCPVSEDLGQALKNYGAQEPITPISNVVQDDLFQYWPPPKLPFRFLHISTLDDSVKNIKGLCQTMADLAADREDFIWAIGGDGDLEQLKVELRKVHFPPERLEILPAMSPQEVAKQMQKSHAFVLYSWVENQPVVLLEALASGRPVISSQVGGTAEFIHEKNGFLVPSGDNAQLKQALEQVMDQYRSFDLPAISAETLQMASRESVKEKYLSVYASALLAGPSDR